MHRSTSIAVSIVIVAVLAAVAHFARFPGSAPDSPVSGTAHAVDGDSLDIAGVRVRLFGIDAPERDQTCRDAQGRTYGCGREARRALAATVAGQTVVCTPVEIDRYKRNVATCTIGSSDIGETMVRAGHALDYARHSRGRYAAAEREAREARRGIWAGEFERPEAWRQQHATR